MIGHIFLKDLRRLWPFVAGLALLHLALALARVRLGLFPDDHQTLRQLVQYGELLAALLIFFTAILAVQLDPLPDDRQDWLVRPIRRRDLLAAKLGFMLVAVLGPLFVADLVQGLVSGFPFGQALTAAGSWTLYEFVNPVLPALAVGAIGRSVGQSLGLGFAIAGGAAALTVGMILGYGAVTGVRLYTFSTLAVWLIVHALLVAGVVVVLRLQYFRRATLASRVVMAAVPVLLLMVETMLPYRTALAMQGWMMPGPDITIAFAPESMKSVIDTTAPRHANPPMRIALPLQVSGLPQDMALLAERVEATFIAPDGDRTQSQDGDIRLAGGAPFQQLLSVDRNFFRTHAGQKVRVELEYILGVTRPHQTHSIAASGGDLWLAEGAHCASRIKADGTGIQLGCLQPGNLRARLSAGLLDGDAVHPGAWRVRHFPSEAPWSNASEMIVPYMMELPLRDPNAPLPQVAVTMAEPVTHMVRRVVIQDVQLGAWAVKTGEAP
jgi:hypothetical protein